MHSLVRPSRELSPLLYCCSLCDGLSLPSLAPRRLRLDANSFFLKSGTARLLAFPRTRPRTALKFSWMLGPRERLEIRLIGRILLQMDLASCLLDARLFVRKRLRIGLTAGLLNWSPRRGSLGFTSL